MRIVVSGATGNTGVAVVETLSKLGHEVVAVSRTPTSDVSKRLAALPNVTVAQGNQQAFEKPVDRAYVCFPPIPTIFTEETDFLMHAKKANVKYVVKLATGQFAMDDPLNRSYYARSHTAIEHILEQTKIPFTSLRAGLFFSYVGVNWEEVKTTKKFNAMIGKAPAALIDPTDIGRAAATLLALPDPSPHYGKKYNLGGHDMTADMVAKELSEVLGETITLDHSFTEDESINFQKQFGIPPGLAEATRGQMKDIQELGILSNTRYPPSPEILAIAPPSTTFKQFLQKLYAK